MIKFKKLFQSFKFAGRGIWSILKTEQNFRIHLLVAVLTLILAALLKIALWQWVVIIMMILLVLILEMINTSFERLVDMLKPRVHTYAADIKNIMSAMVLITAVFAVIIGLIIFVPYLNTFFV